MEILKSIKIGKKVKEHLMGLNFEENFGKSLKYSIKLAKEC